MLAPYNDSEAKMGREKKDFYKKQDQKAYVKMENIYKTLNKIQHNDKKKVVFIGDESIIPIFENIVRDLGLSFTKKKVKKRMRYEVYPNKNKKFDLDIDLNELEDEMLEEGQLF